MNERRQDFELLQRFTSEGEQSAFADLVRRHLDLVFATAMRKVEDPGAAQEVAQNVFAALARKAWRFAPDDSLPAWLHKAALLESKSWLRGELGRRRREEVAAELGTTMNTPEDQSALAALVPLLDEALLSLREKDRTALLLRFYESHSLRDVGAAVCVSEDAARMRVQSALEKLAEFFKRRGFKTATVAVATAALEHTATTAAAAVATAVVSAALQAAPPELAGFKALLARLATLTRKQKTAVGSPLAVCLCLLFARSCEAATKPAISIERAGTNVTVRFTGALQRAGQAQGPFRPVPGARSPWVVPAGAGQEFWRAWLPGVRSIAAGVTHSVALRTDGTLWEWGRNHLSYEGIPNPSGPTGGPPSSGTNTPQQVGSDTNWQTVAAGWGYTVALRTDGTLWAWGNNYSGQLGIGTFTANAPYGTNTPQRIGSDTNWQTVAAAYYHTMALRTDGTLWAWGANSYGELGIGSLTTNAPYGTNTPQQVGTNADWQEVAPGAEHTVALRTDGTLWAWGHNNAGQLGNGTYTSTTTPQQVGTNSDWQAIAAGHSHTVALRADGTLWAWGDNENGQLGIGTFGGNTNTLQQVGTNVDWRAITAGEKHNVAFSAGGTLWTWGKNHRGQLGIGTFSTNAPYGTNTPQRVGTDTNWQAFAARHHTMALRTDGTLWTWGWNYWGQLGIGTFSTNNGPQGTNTQQQVGTNTNWGPPP